MRVLHVLDHSLPLHSGYAFRTRAIMTAQRAAGLDVRGITGLRHRAPGPAHEDVDGLVFHRTGGRVSRLPARREWQEIARLAQAIERLCGAWRPDVLHAHSPALCGMAALRAAGRINLPLVYEIRAFWEDAAVGNGTGREGSLRYRLTRALENRVIAGADAVVAICAGLRDDLIARGVPADRITLSPNGVDLTLLGRRRSADRALADRLALGPGPVVGFIGSFYDYEGLDILIAAMPALAAARPDIQLLLVGGGPCEAALRRQALHSPAGAAIHFAGRVPHGDVARYYALIDVMAYPRKASRLTELVTPLKPLEALAQGTLVAASAVGGHRELLRHGLTASLFTPDDPAACAAALAELLGQQESWPDRRARGLALVRDHHDWARNVSRYQPVYQALLNRPPAQRIGRAA